MRASTFSSSTAILGSLVAAACAAILSRYTPTAITTTVAILSGAILVVWIEWRLAVRLRPSGRSPLTGALDANEAKTLVDPDMDGDPELYELFGRDAHLWRFVVRLKSAPHLYAHIEPSPQFREALTRSLMRAAWQTAAAGPAWPWYIRLIAPQPLATIGAVIGAALVAALAVVSLLGQPAETVVVHSPQDGQITAASQPIVLNFNRPMDRTSVQESIDIEPQAEIVYVWTDSTTLKIVPTSALASGTQYRVTLASSARTAQGRQLGRPSVVQFTTLPPATATP